MIKVICIESDSQYMKSYYDNEPTSFVSKDKIYYINEKESRFNDESPYILIYFLNKKREIYEYLDIFSKKLFIPLDEWREQRINKILDE